MQEFRINITHNDELVESKISLRDYKKYPTKKDFVLAAIKNFTEDDMLSNAENNSFVELVDRVNALERELKIVKNQIELNTDSVFEK